MGKIVVLDELTANKIAAGEVVERPASIVKELVENAIDAGSTRIEVSITDGGIAEISVTDNGSGMDSLDARLAFERHATSKIKDADDLDSIVSLGFRGEALPSIAAVSRLNLRTRVKDAISGVKINIEGGRIYPISETGCPVGTTIQVSDLFFNTPARKKHLKGPNTEAGHVSDVVNKFAMGYPHISFQLTINGRIALKTSGNGDLLEAIACVYGTNLAREMLSVEAHSEDGDLSGYIGQPSLSRSGKSHQIIFINGRFVRNWLISDAVEKAYHSMIMIGRHPIFVINLKINPTDVDVNVHPAKTEVRLAQADRWGDFITAAAADSLSKNRLIPGAELGLEIKPETRLAAKPKQPKEIGEEAKQQAWPMSTVRHATGTNAAEPLTATKPAAIVKPAAATESDTATETAATVEPVAVLEKPAGNEYTVAPVKPLDNEVNASGQFPELRPIGQINCTYIVAQGLNGMYLIDQHAAHERVLYEKFMEKPDEIVASTQLLFPAAFQLTYQESQVLNDHIINFTDLGFVIEHFGGETFLLRAVPSGTAKNGGKEIFLDLLDYFSHNRQTISGKALREKVIITMACKAAIKANEKLGLPEMESLIGQLAGTRHPYTCPHGRPTLIYFSGYDLEKKFKRVV